MNGFSTWLDLFSPPNMTGIGLQTSVSREVRDTLCGNAHRKVRHVPSVNEVCSVAKKKEKKQTRVAVSLALP